MMDLFLIFKPWILRDINMQIVSYLLVGLIAGIFAGLLGIGGGIVMIPVFILIFGLTQHQAQGTCLAAMLPPVFIFAVWKYYQQGNVKLQMAIFVAVGLCLGAYFGADLAQYIPDSGLRRVFGGLLILLGLKMVLLR